MEGSISSTSPPKLIWMKAPRTEDNRPRKAFEDLTNADYHYEEYPKVTIYTEISEENGRFVTHEYQVMNECDQDEQPNIPVEDTCDIKNVELDELLTDTKTERLATDEEIISEYLDEIEQVFNYYQGDIKSTINCCDERNEEESKNEIVIEENEITYDDQKPGTSENGASSIEDTSKTEVMVISDTSDLDESNVKPEFTGGFMTVCEVIFTCKLCTSFSTLKKEDFFHHIETEHKKTVLKCKNCDYCTVHQCKLKNHNDAHEKAKQNKINLCDACGYKTFKKSLFKNHLKTHETFKCMFCEYTNKLKISMLRHEREVHNYYKMFCDKCNFQTSGSHNMITHKLKAHGDNYLHVQTVPLFNLLPSQIQDGDQKTDAAAPN